MLECVPLRKGRFSEYLREEDVRRIRGHELDFLLRFAFGILRGEVLRAARYGVWSFHHDDEETYRGGPPGFWEMYRRDPVTGAILQRLTERLDGGVVLRKGFLRTHPYSYRRNLDAATLESARWPALVCADLQHGLAEYLDRPPSATRAPVFKAPSNLQMLVFFGRMASSFLARAWAALFGHDLWNIGIVDRPIGEFLRDGPRPEVRWFAERGRRSFRADPFGVVRDDAADVFFEDFDYRTYKGRIGRVRLVESDSRPGSAPVIEFPVHASYPYLLEDRGGLYCIPETFRSREIALYRVGSPERAWEKSGVLLSGVAAVDTTAFRHGGRWWLAFTDRDHGANLNLFLWYADDLYGPYRPHARNPVKTDVRSSRPGGTPFEVGGVLYRPAQDCSRTNGGRIVINRVLELSPTVFREEATVVVEPDRAYPAGTHTLSAVGARTLIDGKRRTFIPWAVLPNLRRMLGRSAHPEGD